MRIEQGTSIKAKTPDPLGFLRGGGAAAQLIIERDWSTHPLGAPETWPTNFKSALSLVLNSPESMILAWGPELSFFFNETYFPLLGPRLPWAMGERFDKVWADGWEQAKPIIDAAFAGRPERFNDLPWKLGTDRGSADTWWTFSYSRVLDAEGQVAGLFIFTNETTARVLGDAALRESEERLRLVVESAKDHVILIIDPAVTVIEWAGGAQTILGWSAQEIVGQPVSIIFTPEDRAAGVHERELAKARHEGCAADERWHLAKDGHRVFLNGSVHRLPLDAQGRERGFIKIARDETVRRAADQARAEEAERQRLSLQQMPGFVAILQGPNHSYEYVNDAYVTISGPRDFIGRSVREVFPELKGQGFYELLDTAYASGEPYIAQALPIRLQGEDEDRYIDLLYRPIQDGTGKVTGIFVGGYDISERVRAERDLALANATLEERVTTTLKEREAAEDALRQSQKLEAVGQLTGGVAHDFNNLLTIIRSSIDYLKRDDLPAARRGRYVEAISETVERASRLTNQLLAFARRQALKPEVFDVSARVQSVTELIRPLVGGRIAIDVDPCHRPCHVKADVGQFETALLNLAVNARDAMDGEGRLTFVVREVGAVPPIRGHAGAEGDFIRVSVSDTGQGIAPNQLDSIFEPFFTTKPVGKGTGLGLSQVFGFTKQSGGEVDVESALGRGSTFSLYLPRVMREAAIQTSTDLNDRTSEVSGALHVLIVEDNETVGRFADEMMQDLGHRTRLVGSAAQALDVLAESHDAYDVVFSDVIMPGMNGVELAREIRRLYPGLPVVLTSGYSTVLAQEGPQGFELLRKPYSIEELSRVLCRIVARARGNMSTV